MTPRLLLLILCLCSPVLADVETWTDQQGRTMQAELLDVNEHRNWAEFRKEQNDRRYRVLISTLSDADQERVHAAALRFAAQREERRRSPAADTSPAGPAAPAQPKTDQAPPSAKTKPTPDPKDAAKPASNAPRLPSVTHNLSELLVTLKDKAFVPVPPDTLKPLKFYGIYFAAGWSGASRKFTPELVAAYPALKAAYPEFEIIFVSADESEPEMLAFMTEEKMPWPAVGYENIKIATSVRKHRSKGVPNLVFVNAHGKLLASSYVKVKPPEAPNDASSPPPPPPVPPRPTPPSPATPKDAPPAQSAAAKDAAPTAPAAPKEIDVYEGPHKVLAFIREYLANPPPPPKPVRRPSPAKTGSTSTDTTKTK
ncbi:thioredoxin-like domain-containing protein [Geminisphaera colitermitum]|uniref:thioredoxin-like domain-containing protein n=1 Tax=Geminisphaera colitermitum TaxID=1148786 RepID=UPI0001965388|nr:thioredoxin-like domain-containing protein [Geminisphaera colitermitum]